MQIYRGQWVRTDDKRCTNCDAPASWHSVIRDISFCTFCLDPRQLPTTPPSEETFYILGSNRAAVMSALENARLMVPGDEYGIDAEDLIVVLKLLKRMTQAIAELCD